MGMSASQARLLSLTSRMHDLEAQAQSIQYSKLDLVNSKNDVYDEYMDALDSTKYQMSVVTLNGNEFVDMTYTNMVMANTAGVHSMYAITNAKGQIMLPEQIASKLGPEGYRGNMDNFEGFPSERDFMLIVAKNYLYSGRVDISGDDGFINQMKSDGNYDYWKGIYYQIIGGYKDENDNPVAGRGYCAISRQNATDRVWLEESLNSGDAQIFKLTREQIEFGVDNKFNIFAQTGLAVDTELQEVEDTERIKKATVKYENAIKDIDGKETKLDMQLARIDTLHNALKTEFDSVKQIVSKNIDRSFKTFNA